MRMILKIIQTVVLISIINCSNLKDREGASHLTSNVPEKVDRNLISCPGDNIFLCQIEDALILERVFRFPVQLEVEYSFECGQSGRPQDYFVGIKSKSDGFFLPFQRFGQGDGRRKKMVIEGHGPFYVLDSDPEWTKNNPNFDKNCYIAVHFYRLISYGSSGERHIKDLMQSVEESHSNYRVISQLSNLLNALQPNITKLDLTATKSLFAEFRKNIESLDGEDTAGLTAEIDLIMTLNPSVDPRSNIDEKINNLMTRILEITKDLLQKISAGLSSRMVQFDEILLPFNRDQYRDYRIKMSRIKHETKVEDKDQNLLHWSFAGPIDGLNCTPFDEPSDRSHTWGDNYLCSSYDIGLQFSSAGPIANKRCTLVNEPADKGGTWEDNYVCWSDPKIDLTWFYFDPGKNTACVRVHEPAEPFEHTWDDNFICW